ncbi:hypothetical protein VOLCADRAFT_119533 [Volvox carteri f. nagariensis]|uniref:Uncharacterized protein n=1 Tax=Volvox carteri f. nagariensis TaxID=3068 RepID=D8UDW2_VOLCA|nr:uncharacterized protein VOLCADRAFT_119533 [Volvox carteri f. nagariensis]EFJ42115.1 hypothetical protein VOLCADRAFT_119533 [Volvox carteri f. nagariensis]|eukprot:XP_002956812.1 hypothetical protein VOLCADRAFT_119533 [Volvox carteri f. nagariensis]
MPPPRAAVTHSAAQLLLSAFVSPVCFNQVCQQDADRAFLLAVAVPLLAAAAVVSYLMRSPPAELTDSGRVFEDPSTGTRFEAPEGVVPERDKNGELAFRPISYTPWPVDEGVEGERVRLAVGPVGSRQLRTYVFARVLPVPSDILTVTLPRPLGVVLEYEERFRRATVVDLIEGTYADQRRKKAALNSDLVKDAVLPGDVLRAVTATNFVYPTRALFGAAPPERHIHYCLRLFLITQVVYGADKQSWSSICGALKRGEARDGDVTLVLERRRPRPPKEPRDGSALDIFA